MTIATKNRKRYTQPPAQPVQQSMFDATFNGEMRLMHELFLRGQRAEFISGLTTPESRRRVARQQLGSVAAEASKSVRGKTVGQLFQDTYREAL